jgi:hypothetical protein
MSKEHFERTLPTLLLESKGDGHGDGPEETFSSYSEIYSKCMSVDWNEFSSCLKGRMSGFKKFYNFRRIGKLIHVYNKTCWAFGLPPYKRSTCINRYEKEEMRPIVSEILRHADPMSLDEAEELTKLLNSIAFDGDSAVEIKGIPEVVIEEEAKNYIDDMTARLEALEKYEKCVEKEEALRRQLEEEGITNATYPERNLPMHRDAVERLKKSEGKGIVMLSDKETCFTDEENKFKHSGQPVVKEMKRKDTVRKSVKFPNKHVCQNLEDLKSHYIAYYKRRNEMEPKKSPPKAHDWSQLRATVTPHAEKKKLEEMSNSTTGLSIAALKKVDFKIFPVQHFYHFLENLLQKEVFLSEYSSYLRVGDGLKVYQCRTYRTDTMFSDKIVLEIFWKRFNSKYNKPENMQKLMLEFTEVAESVDQKTLQKHLLRFFNLVKSRIKCRRKRFELESLPVETKLMLSNLLATYSPGVFCYRKKVGMTSGTLRSLIKSRVSLMKPS